jgi:hypothetical protein
MSLGPHSNSSWESEWRGGGGGHTEQRVGELALVRDAVDPDELPRERRQVAFSVPIIPY